MLNVPLTWFMLPNKGEFVWGRMSNTCPVSHLLSIGTPPLTHSRMGTSVFNDAWKGKRMETTTTTMWCRIFLPSQFCRRQCQFDIRYFVEFPTYLVSTFFARHDFLCLKRRVVSKSKLLSCAVNFFFKKKKRIWFSQGLLRLFSVWKYLHPFFPWNKLEWLVVGPSSSYCMIFGVSTTEETLGTGLQHLPPPRAPLSVLFFWSRIAENIKRNPTSLISTQRCGWNFRDKRMEWIEIEKVLSPLLSNRLPRKEK